MSDKKWQFWVDRGGTFTDIVALRPDGQIRSHKLLSENPERYADAAVQGIRDMLDLRVDQPVPKGVIEAVKMGTTVATNALLERKGDRTLLMITKGLKDLLRIGYQNRPKLFDLNIELPEQLYETSIEVTERVDHNGAILKNLDEPNARQELESAYSKGIRVVAIALMHSYKFPNHEIRLAEIAREVGFTQVSVSYEVSPLVKLVSRGDTTVLDAYLSPILRRYVRQVSDALGEVNLMFMQSNGGLTDAHLFQGKDAILSGPAGGVVGMVRTASRFDNLIGFDMGGTSTDVCHYAGQFERSFETEVAGVRMRAPMMSIHTVAAGGGSILSFQNGRFLVGPESAGADPGPACYRRGGPLTVTDCNVLLGKLQADQFPKVFGENGDQPLDVNIVRQKFTELAANVAQETNSTPKVIEETAEGFLKIAVENMAQAIKKISVQRGYDVTKYTLNCFGGAGGQHACLVADALGMEQIFIHPLAGVLSAFGIGLADIRALREGQVEAPLSDVNKAQTTLVVLAKSARLEVAQQGILDKNIRVEMKAHLRYDGSHQALEIPFGTISEMGRSFRRAHQTRYGFVPESGDLIIEMVAVEAIGETGTSVKFTPSNDINGVELSANVYTNNRHQSIPMIERGSLNVGNVILGPAILTEPTGTNFVEPGWQAEADNEGNLILTRAIPKTKHQAIGTAVDPVMLEVFNNFFMSIAEQMGATLANTAYSVNIKERLDFSCAIFGPTGDLVANAPHVPVHLGSMSESVRIVLDLNRQTMRAGDVFMLNNPFNGGTHLPDVTVITPVFDKAGSEIIFLVASRGHHADIGGTTPGSAPPNSTHIEQEGVVIDNFLLVKQGVLQETETRAILASGKYPCRNIKQNMADLAAQIAANATGVAELQKMVSNYSLSVVNAYMGHVQDNAEASVRAAIGALKNSSFTYPLDSGKEIKVAITIDAQTQSATVDFTGTSAQDTGNYNAPLSICRAAVLYVFRTLIGSDIPLNEGCLRPIKLIVPEGSMINPRYPAAVIAGNTEVSQAITDALYGALGVVAGSQGTMNNFIYGNEQIQNYETICGGAGAGPTFDGADAVHTHMTNTRMTDPEILENRFPVRVEEFSIRKGSGGQGKHKGGEGIYRRIRFLEPMTVTTLTSHRITKPFGVEGGQDGSIGENQVLRTNGSIEKLKGNDTVEMEIGDIFEMKTPGGGGFGKP